MIFALRERLREKENVNGNEGSHQRKEKKRLTG